MKSKISVEHSERVLLKYWWVCVVFVAPFCCLFAIVACSPKQKTIPVYPCQPPVYKRGHQIIYMRYSKDGVPVEDIVILATGEATRGPPLDIDAYPPQIYTRVPLPETVWHGANDIRIKWCQTRPAFLPPEPEESCYGISLLCNELGRTQQIFIPANQLPESLVHVLQIVPTPSAQPESEQEEAIPFLP